MFSDIPLAPVDQVIRPQREDIHNSSLDKWWHRWQEKIFSSTQLRTRKLKNFSLQVVAYEASYQSFTDNEIVTRRKGLQGKLIRNGFTEQLVAECFALIREVSKRVLGMQHYKVQVMGGYAMLRGMIAEMETGEGKTLTATLTAATVALAGVPVHVISVNDYLTQRDADTMRLLYEALGLTVGCVNQDVAHEDRLEQYQRNIIYCTNKDVTFDYLRDRIALGQQDSALSLYAEHLYGKGSRMQKLLLPGLHFAIIDEADSILVDEARTPLIISATADSAPLDVILFEQSVDFSQHLKIDEDFTVDHRKHKVELTSNGSELLVTLVKDFGAQWQSRLRREELVTQALIAEHLYLQDEHYLVRDGKIMIIDEYTGRVMPDRSWEYGLHQLIELKEGCELTPPRETLARMSYQRFFCRYLYLSGMTGTAEEVRDELWSVYSLRSARIPTRQESKRQQLGTQVFLTKQRKINAIVLRVKNLHQQGRAILIGTASVAASEELSEAFTKENLKHQVLNAKQDSDEAGLVENAGQAGQITIATSMAGRGTDIKLQKQVKQCGGLFVLIVERNDAGRIDRQLAGRCARQGDPGNVEYMLSLEDNLVSGQRGGWRCKVAKLILQKKNFVAQFIAKWTINWAQKRVEKLHYQMRRDLLKNDHQQGELLSFSGRQE